MDRAPAQRDEFSTVWPQGRVSLDCFATLAMDLTAPFISDMGLCQGIQELRSTIRVAVEKKPTVFNVLGASSEEISDWTRDFAGRLGEAVAQPVREHFWAWVQDTYTLAPADRPNWEMYEMFFFEWSVQMRDGQDIAGCFGDARSVYETYHAFVRARRLDERIRESRHRCLSAWDQKILGLRSYPVLEAEMDPDTTFDPFAVVEATADRNYFQQFWEHLLPLLTKGEQKALLNSLQRRYETDFRLPNMVAPAALTRGIR